MRNRAGSQFEWAFARWLVEQGFFYAEPRRAGGSRDRGDLSGIHEHVVELKATRAIDLAGAMTEAEAERKNAGEKYKVIVHKRRNHPISKAYVTMEAEQWVAYLHAMYSKGWQR